MSEVQRLLGKIAMSVRNAQFANCQQNSKSYHPQPVKHQIIIASELALSQSIGYHFHRPQKAAFCRWAFSEVSHTSRLRGTGKQKPTHVTQNGTM